MAASNRLAVTMTLPDGWREIDLADPVPGCQTDAVWSALVRAGLGEPPADELVGSVVLSAALLEPPLAEFPDEPPLMASVVIVRQPVGTPVRVTLVDGVDVVPERSVSRRSVDLAGADVTFLQVSYRVPHPDGAEYLVATFTTPNLPLQQELEFLFDSIVSTISWVEAD